MKNSNYRKKLLKVLLHPSPPLERESLIRIVELTIPKVTTLSIQKRHCEKYLFQWVCGEGLVYVETKIIDFRWKPYTMEQK